MRALAPLALALAACAGSPEPHVPAVAPPPLALAVGPLLAGMPVTLTATGAGPGDTVWFGVGDGTGRPRCPRSLQGACYELRHAQLLGTAVAGRGGIAELHVTVPAHLPDGRVGFFQAVGVGAAGYASPVVQAAIAPATDCTAIVAAFEAEAAAVRSCTDAGECGQVLQGTSCGCTRDWVARVGVDTTAFYALLDEASARCGYALGSTCDCPPASGFDCVDQTCTWAYLP